MPRLGSLLAGGIVGLLCVRRAVLLGAALLPARPLAEVEDEPSVALLVAAHDEAALLGRLLATVERLDWPRDRLHVVLADDGSADGTWEGMHSWAEANDGARALRLDRVGKSQALNAALAAAPAAELVVAVDADLRLAPDYLRRLTPAFRGADVAAASAFVTAANPDATLVARYAALETWVHQLVTAAGKDRLALNPPTFAGSAYRRSALEEVGGFPAATAGDDVGASAALTRAGWRTCFVRAARADHVLAPGVADYWRQHLRWSRNVYEAGLTGTRSGSAAGRPRRVELGLAGVGYGDRLAFAGALALAATRRLSPAVPAAYAALRALESVVAVVKAGHGRRLPAYLAAAALVLPLDLAASVAAAVALRSRGAPAWRSSERRGSSSDPLEERLSVDSGGVAV
jgi:GT2 family glycosyltransferase